MSFKYANNAVGNLASGISAGATSITLQTGQGALFPAITGTDIFQATLSDAATGALIEIVQVTARTGDVLTVVRGQEGTTAKAYLTGDVCSQRITALELNDFPSKTYDFNWFQHGQCRLTLPGANLVLAPYNGNKIIINNVVQTIPSAGVTLLPTSSTASTLYYIYAFMSGGTMTLEFSTTVYATDANSGIVIKNGDVTRTLVGMARTTASATWVSTLTSRLVASWFNPMPVQGNASFGSNQATSSTSLVELSTTGRVEFVTFAGRNVDLTVLSSPQLPAASTTASTAIGVDGTAIAPVSNSTGNASFAISIPGFCRFLTATLSEGYHFTSIYGSTSSGNTITWPGSNNTMNEVIIQG